MSAARVRFGITLLPDAAPELLEWARTAEAAGFERVGIADSQSLYRDVYVSATLCARETRRVLFGPDVTNPLTRHPAVSACAAASVEELAPGRTFFGIGTGDSATYNLGLGAATHAQLREYVRAVRELWLHGEAIYEGRRAVLTWARPTRIPVYLAASGPKTLRLAGEIADGVVIKTGLEPSIVRDSIAQVQAGARVAGRDPAAIDLWWLPLCSVRDSRAEALAEIGTLLASAGNHLARFTTEGKHVPQEHIDAVRELGRRYHFQTHDMPTGPNADLVEELGLKDYLAQRFAIVGPPAECIRRIEQAAEAGATNLWMPVHFADTTGFIRRWTAEVMVAFH
jgi:5,10-methylenetetrahydromethanopterin reductase